MKNLLHNILIATVILSLNCAPIAVYAMPEPVPAGQTDKQKAAEKKAAEKSPSTKKESPKTNANASKRTRKK